MMTVQPLCVSLALLVLGSVGIKFSAGCPENFTSPQDGFCLHLRSDGPKMDWCRAQSICNAIGGRLLSTVSKLVALQPVLAPLTSTDKYYVGFTDMMKEAETSRSGWLSTDDGELPINITNTMWLAGKPDNFLNADCLILTSSDGSPMKLSDAYCKTSYGFICEPGPQSYSKPVSVFAKSALPSSQPLETAPFYCAGEKKSSDGRIHCVSLCAANPVCKAVLFNKATRACRQILHGDAAVEAAVETDANWEKFVR